MVDTRDSLARAAVAAQLQKEDDFIQEVISANSFEPIIGSCDSLATDGCCDATGNRRRCPVGGNKYRSGCIKKF